MSKTTVLEETYKQYIQSEPGEVTIEGRTIITEPEVVAMHKAVLITGQCYYQECADACRAIFLGAKEVTTKAEYLATLPADASNPFTVKIVDKIKELWS